MLIQLNNLHCSQTVHLKHLAPSKYFIYVYVLTGYADYSLLKFS